MSRPKRTWRRLVALFAFSLIVVSAVLYLYVAGRSGGSTGLVIGTPRQVTVIDAKPEISTYITEYPVGSGSEPNAIAFDAAGNAWFVLGNYYAIGELNPANHTLHVFRLPGTNGSTIISWGIFVDSTNGSVWFTDQSGNAVWSFGVHSREFMRHSLNPFSTPYQITGDRSGSVWFTELDGGKLGEITVDGALHEFSVPLGAKHNVYSQSVGPAGITVSKDGTIWFTEVYADSVGTFFGGQFHSFDLSGSIQSPTGIGLDSSGRAWIAEHGKSFISVFDPSSNSVTTYSTSNIDARASLPYFIYVGPHDSLWFNEHYGNAIAEFIPSNQSLIEYRIPSRVSALGNISGALTMTLSPSGQPWFTEMYTGKIGTVSTNRSSAFTISLLNSTTEDVFGAKPGENSTLRITVKGTGSTSVHVAVGGDGSGLSLKFLPASGSGSFTSTLSLYPSASSPVNTTYTVTISAADQELVVSKVVYLRIELPSP